jgi:predicted AAA+ superfamily ATPase
MKSQSSAAIILHLICKEVIHILEKEMFEIGESLLQVIDARINNNNIKLERRDFVEPLIGFCLNNDFDAKLGIVFGLRSTGKTVGMLQAAESLVQQGKKVAYAHFNYKRSSMYEVSTEIAHLSKDGFTHFFIDEAPYLGEFLTNSAEWADIYVPKYRIKLVISGTDSFELWLAMNRSLYHRYVCFSTNRNSYPEYKRILKKGYDDYKAYGGVFLDNEYSVSKASLILERSDKIVMETFINDAIVENLINTLEHCNEDSSTGSYYLDWLYAIDKQVIYKGVIALLQSAAESMVRKNFINNAMKKSIPQLGEILSNWPSYDKENIKSRIAAQIGIYQNSIKIENPKESINALIEFLVRIECLVESSQGLSDLVITNKTLFFAHPALMNYALEETKKAISSLSNIDVKAFSESVDQAAAGAMNENIVFFHFILFTSKDYKIFQYHDENDREIDIVVVNRKLHKLYLIEVKSTSRLESKWVFKNEARHLYDNEILNKIGIDDEFNIIRIIAYRGNNLCLHHIQGPLFLLNIEQLLCRIEDLDLFIDDVRNHFADDRKSDNRSN